MVEVALNCSCRSSLLLFMNLPTFSRNPVSDKEFVNERAELSWNTDCVCDEDAQFEKKHVRALKVWKDMLL